MLILVKSFWQKITPRQVEDWTRLQHPHWKSRFIICCKSPKLDSAPIHLETLHLTIAGLSPHCRHYSWREMLLHGASHHRAFLLWESLCASGYAYYNLKCLVLHGDDNTWYYKLIEPIFARLDFLLCLQILMLILEIGG